MVTLFYAGLLTLLVVALSARVIVLRNRHRVAIGDGGNQELQLAIRAHGNTLEYIPLALVLMLMLESVNIGDSLLHGLGLLLLAGRLIHAYSIPARNLKLRVTGMILTFLMLLVSAGIGLGLAVTRLSL
ncbi:MAPEG family protein [Bowmanella dokdonensis]|uniref:MAPEG family protein n=1 Tax=Bowmanella dokdonensis TaxID=751969 RepID=A0A939DRL3_9ALTE|nr:MAPEG family protein [Bowmanella dokdonensis]MBN7826945.1 MAPEG family protein [Bowmanella dokdonensis]